MSSDFIRYEIVEGFRNTIEYVEKVRLASDANRNEFGFLPSAVYKQFAQCDGMYVLVAHSGHGTQYAGHLMFSRQFPKAHVRQIYISPVHRRRGLAQKLLSQLKTSLTQDGYMSIYARVAEDLSDANAFWQQQHFRVQRLEKGGDSRARQILVRCFELDSPQLVPSSGWSEVNPLGLRIPMDAPMFLVDLNVLFDVAPRRLRREQVISLFQAERMNYCKLAISMEIREELARTALTGKTDPMGAYIDTFPCIPVDDRASVRTLMEDIAKIVFSAKASAHTLSPNDLSDVRHVVAAIQNRLAGLITNDNALLDAAIELENAYGIRVVSPGAFRLHDHDRHGEATFKTTTESTLRVAPVTTRDESSVRSMLNQLGISGSAIASAWLPISGREPISERVAVWCEATCVGFASWPALVQRDVIVRAGVLESHHHANSAARAVLLFALERATLRGPRRLRLELSNHQPLLRESAATLGFRGSPVDTFLVKSALGKVLTTQTWAKGRESLANIHGPQLPSLPPDFSGPDQQIVIRTPDNNRAHVSLEDLETLLSPALLCLSGRPAVISPVRRDFSEALLLHSPQLSFLPAETAALFSNRHYLSDPRTFRHFKRGTLILFYESKKKKGHGAIVAIGRVRRSYLRHNDAISQSDLEPSVLNKDDLAEIGVSPMKAVTVFDNIFPCMSPVPLSVLRRLGCGQPNDLITTNAISDAQLQSILKEAFADE